MTLRLGGKDGAGGRPSFPQGQRLGNMAARRPPRSPTTGCSRAMRRERASSRQHRTCWTSRATLESLPSTHATSVQYQAATCAREHQDLPDQDQGLLREQGHPELGSPGQRHCVSVFQVQRERWQHYLSQRKWLSVVTSVRIIAASECCMQVEAHGLQPQPPQRDAGP